MQKQDLSSEFLRLYDKVVRNYFNKDGIPYHAFETVVVEAPDHGHETTSEAISLWVYVEAVRGHLTGDWTGLKKAWDVVESFFIPKLESYADYNPNSPAMYAPEEDSPEQYPVSLTYSVPPGKDPIAAQLKSTYGPTPYSMHWLGDPDNLYGFGGPGEKKPVLFNTFQRGPRESVWKTVPQPCTDDLKYGGKNGYLDIFVAQENPPAQSKYTVASDADARCLQALLWAKLLADKRGGSAIVDDIVSKCVKMGDWLVYSMFDKYFLKIGTQDAKIPASGMEAFHGLLSWYTAYGGPLQSQGWAFRIACSHSHAGYQNPLAAFAMARFFPSRSSKSIFERMWETSMFRQIELYCWLQSKEGAIAGGVTNSWNGRYEKYPEGTSMFYGMAYTPHPVYLEPPSNQWSGMNAWGMERVVQLYYLVRDKRMGNLVRNWIRWVVTNVKIDPKNGVLIPATLEWTGKPDSDWNGSSNGSVPKTNKGLSCRVKEYGKDLGVMASLLRSLVFFNAMKPVTAIQRLITAMTKDILSHEDERGMAVEEERGDYLNFDTPVFVPPGWSGKMPLGDDIDQNSTFFSIRKSLFENDPMYRMIRNSIDSDKVPKITVHRFWAQCEILLTFGFHAILTSEGGAEDLRLRPSSSTR